MLVFQCKFQEKTSNGAMFTNHPLCLSSLFKALFSKPDHVTACYDCTEKHFFPNIKTILVYTFTFSNYESKEDLGLSGAETQINFNMTSHFVVT